MVYPATRFLPRHPEPKTCRSCVILTPNMLFMRHPEPHRVKDPVNSRIRNKKDIPMNTTYAQKSSIVQKVADSKAASILDSSAQGESLQRKADMVNGTVQCKNERCGCGNVAQMQMVNTDYNNYNRLYADEIQRTKTSDALTSLGNVVGKLRFTDDLYECKVSPFDDNTVGNAIAHNSNKIEDYVNFVCIPGEKFKMPGAQCAKGVYHKLQKKVNSKDIRRIYAIHELEHLRIINKNITDGTAAVGMLGEPGRILDYNAKKQMKSEIEREIPLKDNLTNEGVKAKYIRERLDYAVFPCLKGVDSSRECPSVLLELIKLCEACPELKTERWEPFKVKLVDCYNSFL